MEINLEKCNDIKIIDPHWFTQCIGIKVRFLNFIGWLISNIAYILRDDGTILRYIYISNVACILKDFIDDYLEWVMFGFEMVCLILKDFMKENKEKNIVIRILVLQI